MDLSQLPKMGETPKPPPPMPPEPRRPVYRDEPAGGSIGAISVWISLIIGLIFLAIGGNFGRWLVGKATGHEYVTGIVWSDGAPKAGQPVTYLELDPSPVWSDASFFVMGVALIVDAVLLFAVYQHRGPRRALLALALAVTGIALALNVGYAGHLFSNGVLPLMSLVAVLVAGIMLFEQVALWREVRGS